MNSSSNKTIKISVAGRVQGVNYRRSVSNYAKSLRLTGYAENLIDGSVEVVAQGPEEHIEELLKWCQRGSMLAKVKSMSYNWIETEDVYQTFRVEKSDSFLKDQAKSFFNLGKRIKEDIGWMNKDYVIPNHVVIIPNGNRTWSKQKNLKPWAGYWHVQKHMEKLLEGVRDLNINHLTFWGFSTENWKRDDEEVDQLMKVFETTLDKFEKKFLNEGVQFRHLGRKDRLPESLVKKLRKLEDETRMYTEKSLNIAFDYGGRDEILRAVDSIIKSGKTNITEEEFSQMLDTAGIPDPDLIIRTAGEKRLSGIMPWQSIYAEFYSSNVYFPDFGIDHLKEAVMDFSSRKRTFGGDVDKNKQLNEEGVNVKAIPNVAA